MPGYNKVMLIGNLTRDPQVKQLSNQSVLTEFGLATSRRFRTAGGEDKEETCFVDCTAFGRQGETIAQWCRKGKQIFVEGRLKFDSWEDKVGGQKRSKLSIVVENFQFLGVRDNDGAPEGATDAPSAEASGTADPTRRDHPNRDNRPPRKPRKAEQPFGEDKMFQEADIPF